MKTTSPTIRILQLSQCNREGLYPIVIRVQWRGCAEKRTGYAFSKKDWNERTSSVNPRYPNASSINASIQEQYRDILNRSIDLTTLGTQFTAKDVLEKGVVVDNRLDFEYVMNDMLGSRDLTSNTKKAYLIVYHNLTAFIGSPRFLLTDLNCDRCMAFGKYLERRSLKNRTIFFQLCTIGNVWNHAISIGLVDEHLYPYKNITPRKKYGKVEQVKKSVSQDVIDKVESYVMDWIIDNHQDMTDLSFYQNRITRLSLFILGYHMGGLALVDMSNLRKDQVQRMEKNKTTYYVFSNVRRQKTNQPVPIVLKGDMLIKPLMEYYLSTPSQYLLPIWNHKGGEWAQTRAVANVGGCISRELKAFTGLKDITYYACRHTWATNALFSGVNPVALATMMGRSPSGIFSYVKSLSSVDDIIAERERMGM